MPNETEVKLILTVDGDVAISSMKQVRDATQQFADDSSSILDETQDRWAVYSAGVLSAFESVKEGWAAWGEGAKIQQAQDAFANATASMGVNSQELLAQLNATANGTVDDAKLMQESMSLMVRGMSADQLPGCWRRPASRRARWASTFLRPMVPLARRSR